MSYLRISVTDRCDFRCVYCMVEDMTFPPKREVLSFEEIETVANAFIDRGATRIRLTGGEPLVRRDIMELVATLGARISQGLDELTITTNGSQLARHADGLAAAQAAGIAIKINMAAMAGVNDDEIEPMMAPP
ncbi:MAG: radical SAM protein, partial [Candidatus Devosia euplotis]|nr:radical SAM protein [Candidatus Devosia euplotis]